MNDMKFKNIESVVINVDDETQVVPYNVELVDIEFDQAEHAITGATITLKCIADKDGNVLRVGLPVPV